MEQDSCHSLHERFSGIQRLYGTDGFSQLQDSHVLVVGLGGVGSWVVEALGRSGVGTITLVDYDEICISNTNRQLHTTTQTVGRLKADVLKERLLSINPELKVNVIALPFEEKTEQEIFNNSYDCVVDAIDRLSHKIALIVACKKRQIPLLVMGGAGGKIDPTAIQIADLADSYQDKLLALVRKELRNKGHYPRQKKMKLTCVFSPEKPRYHLGSSDFSLVKPQSFQNPLDCNTGFGTATHLTGTFGFFAAHWVLQTLLKNK